MTRLRMHPAARFLLMVFGLSALATLSCFPSASAAEPFRVSVLILGSVRAEPLDGFMDGMAALNYIKGKTVFYDVKDAQGNRAGLGSLAEQIISSRPDLAAAGGGVEADALKAAAAGTDVPVLFLAAASTVDRGLVDTLIQPGGNVTGVDTRDNALTAKRLWFIRQMFPRARRVLIPNIPDIVASERIVQTAKAEAGALGFDIHVLAGADTDEITASFQTVAADDVDVIYIGGAAPVWQICRSVLFPFSVANQVPIIGVTQDNLKDGALATYSCSRYEAGRQAARLAQKILTGTPAADIPVETPSRMEFVINRWVVDKIGVRLPQPVWRLANRVVNTAVE